MSDGLYLYAWWCACTCMPAWETDYIKLSNDNWNVLNLPATKWQMMLTCWGYNMCALICMSYVRLLSCWHIEDVADDFSTHIYSFDKTVSVIPHMSADFSVCVWPRTSMWTASMEAILHPLSRIIRSCRVLHVCGPETLWDHVCIRIHSCLCTSTFACSTYSLSCECKCAFKIYYETPQTHTRTVCLIN